jgi:hypothetical protein
MTSHRINHILALHLFQPPGRLKRLLLESETELQRTLKCYERIARYAHKYADVARIHVVFSAPLVQQLTEPAFIRQSRHLADVADILEGFRSAPNIEFVASGVQHAPLPLIPAQDWDAQLRSERRLIESTFGRQPRMYYPPGGLFTESMIPHLAATGYQLALLPRNALISDEGHPVDPYRVYQLDSEFTVVPIDAGFSHAMGHHLDAPWFADEVTNGTDIAPESLSPYVVTTCCDGDNGEWFRHIDEDQGFFGSFFAPYMEFCETGEYPIRPVNVIDYLKQAKPEPAQLAKQDLSALDHPALKQLHIVSAMYWKKIKSGVEVDPLAHELILQAEGSCFVLDKGSDYQGLTDLLSMIDERLETPSGGEAVKAGNRDTAVTPSPATREPAFAVASRQQPSSGRSAAKPRSMTKSVSEQADQKPKATSNNEKKRGAREKVVVRKTAEKTKKPNSPTGAKKDSS